MVLDYIAVYLTVLPVPLPRSPTLIALVHTPPLAKPWIFFKCAIKKSEVVYCGWWVQLKIEGALPTRKFHE